MAMGANVLDVQQNVGNALDWLRIAMNDACEMSTDPLTGEPYPWPEATEAINRMEAARKILATALEPLAAAVKQAEEDYEHGAAMEDARSY